MKTIVVSVTNDLVTDQRVHKVCTTLIEMGFKIHLIGRELKNSLPVKRDYKTTRMRLIFNKGPLFYVEYNIRLFLLLLFTKKHVLLSNDLDTLLPNFLVAKLTSKPIVYDSHELFTEVPELIHRPKIQKVWLAIESFVFPKLKDVFTVCNSIASYYYQQYSVDVKVLRNVPSQHIIGNSKPPHKITSFIKGKQSLIYQGAVNVGRGIELMIDVVAQMENTVLCIIGNGDVFNEIQQKIERNNLLDKVLLYGAVRPKELKFITPLFDVGLSFEENLGMSYTYALPNKVFDYIQAEIPCLVSDLPEMVRLVDDYKIGEVIQSRSINSIVEKINKLIENKENYTTKLQEAKSILNWENESKVLKQVYTKFL